MAQYNQAEYEKYLREHSDEYESCFWSGSSKNEDGVNYSGDKNAKRVCNEHNGSYSEGTGRYASVDYDNGEKPWKTNEMLLDEAGMLDGMPKDRSDPKFEEAWRSASETTAQNASGQAHVIKGEDGDYDSFYNRYEKPLIRENDKINPRIDIVDPATGQSKASEQKESLSPTEPAKQGKGYNFGDNSSRSLHDDLRDPNLFTDNQPGNYTYGETPYGKHAEGNMTLSDGERNARAQREAGGVNRRPTDDGGHLIGNRFDGSGDAENLDAQDSNINRGSYKQLENREAAQLQNGDQVFTSKDTFKSNHSERPDAYMGYDITEQPDGTRDWDAYSYQNENAATQEAWNSESSTVFSEMASEYPNPMVESDPLAQDNAPEPGQGDSPEQGQNNMLGQGQEETPAKGENKDEAPAEGEEEAPIEGEAQEPAEDEGEGEEPAEGEGQGDAPEQDQDDAPEQGQDDAPEQGQDGAPEQDQEEEPEPSDDMEQEPESNDAPEPEPESSDTPESEPESSDAPEPEPESSDAPEPEPSGGASNSGGPSNDSGPSQ